MLSGQIGPIFQKILKICAHFFLHFITKKNTIIEDNSDF
jgi:hypothetical protein